MVQYLQLALDGCIIFKCALETIVQEARGKFHNYSYIIQSKRFAAMNFIIFIKVARQD